MTSAKAHGRVNLIGEHTDYNGGWVLPTTIPQSTQVELEKRSDETVRITSSKIGSAGIQREFSYSLGHERKLEDWMDYIQGVTSILRTDGHRFSGFDLRVESDVPEGSGLSSSAALEISTLKAIRDAFALPLDDVALARLGQRVENEFVGARVGIMDQMACGLARAGEALFLDTLKLTYERIALPLEKMDLIVVYSGISHRLTGGGYNERRAQCEEACKKLGIDSLREMDESQLARLDPLPDVLRRRARHVITENARVMGAVKAIGAQDLKTLGRLFGESHASMRDDYEVSIPEIDLLVDLFEKNGDVFGARLTGGGFGGSIVALATKGRAGAVLEAVLPEYERKTGEKPVVLVGRK